MQLFRIVRERFALLNTALVKHTLLEKPVLSKLFCLPSVKERILKRKYQPPGEAKSFLLE